MHNQGRARRFAILALLTLIPVQAALWVVDSLYPGHPHLIRFLVVFAVVKIIGDILYFAFWPDYRHWVQVRHYLAEEFIPFFRFGFPASLGQRIVEVTFFPGLAFGLPPATLMEHILIGPLLALAIYLFNRWLIEEAQEVSRASIRDTTHLP